ncbi:MAG: hypothetical protein LCH53_10765 [Bacteroidetes bacterium]|nr:hypothetical protein [Bacteroidota bacterium]
MSKHTPGPWHRNIPPARQYPTVFAGRNTHIAALRPDSRISDEEAEANLNLIAAAPNLLAACERLLDAFERSRAGYSLGYERETLVCEKAKGVLAAVRGEMVEFVEQMPSGDGFLQGCDPGDENDFGEVTP